MKVSVSSYSFQQYINQGKLTQVECVAKAKEMGFETMEFIDMAGSCYEEQVANAKQIRTEADRLGVKIAAYTIGANLYQATPEARAAEVERLKKQLDIAKILGADVMRHDVCYQLGKTGSSRSFDLMLPTLAAAAREVTVYAETLGIRTCSENHGYIAQDSDRVERLFNAVNHDNYGLLVDIGNFVCVDEEPAHAVSRVAPYAVHVHAKDMRVRSQPIGGCKNPTRGCNYFGGTVIGEGDVPVRKCLNILRRAGYDGVVSIEFEGEGDCIESIARSKRNLEQIISELVF